MNSIPSVGSYIKDYFTQEQAVKDKQTEFEREVKALENGIETSKRNRTFSIGALALAAIAVVGLAIATGTFAPLAFAAILIIPAVFVYIHHKTMTSYETALDQLNKKGASPVKNLEYRDDRINKRNELANASPETIKDCGISVEDLVGFRLLDVSSGPSLTDKKIHNFYSQVPELIKNLKENKPEAARKYEEARLKLLVTPGAMKDSSPEDIRDSIYTAQEMVESRLLDDTRLDKDSPKLKAFYALVPVLILNLRAHKPDAVKQYNDARWKMYQ